MTKKTLEIHSENILPIIKKWLYTERDIFLRELVSNSCDALTKLKILRDQNQVSFDDDELKIDIEIDAKNGLLKISDTGIGMTQEEVEKYISRLAFSGAEEFIKKYQNESKDDSMIGHFGLGFYSAFMVSSSVDIETLSYQKEAKGVFWSCDGSCDYLIEEKDASLRGTTVILHIAKEESEFLKENRIRSILNTHCRFLSYPIFLNGKQINEKKPLWIEPPSACSDQNYIDFYHTLYPMQGDPIFWIHINIDYPFHLKGILYFPKLTRRFDPNEPSIHLYCNRVFVSDHCKDIIPDYLTMLRGIIDSPNIPLNVSRSNLQLSQTVRQLSNHIAKKVADKLKTLHQTNPETFQTLWPDIEMIVKLGILQDEKFYERIQPCLIWKTIDNQWTTTNEYLERNGDKTEKKIFYHHDPKQTSPLLELYQNQGIEVICTSSHLDTPLMSFLESKLPGVKFERLDGKLSDIILDKKREKTILDATGKTEAAHIAHFIQSKLNKKEVQVEAKSLSHEEVPAFIIIDEEKRRLREYLSLSGQELPQTDSHTLVVNTNSPLIDSIYKLGEKDPDLAKDLILQLYDLSLLSQKELPTDQLSTFLKRSTLVLDKLSKIAAQPSNLKPDLAENKSLT